MADEAEAGKGLGMSKKRLPKGRSRTQVTLPFVLLKLLPDPPPAKEMSKVDLVSTALQDKNVLSVPSSNTAATEHSKCGQCDWGGGFFLSSHCSQFKWPPTSSGSHTGQHSCKECVLTFPARSAAEASSPQVAMLFNAPP